MTAREIARRVLDRVDKGGAWATLALDAELERSGLEERDRRLASELVYGVLRNRTRLDRALGAHADLKNTPPKVRTVLRVAAYQLLFLDRVPAYAAVDDAVAAARENAGQKLAGFANAVLRKITTEREPPLPPAGDLGQTLARLEIEHSIPRWILDELTASTRDAADRPARVTELAAALNEQAPLIARVNVRRTTRDALAAELRASRDGGDGSATRDGSTTRDVSTTGGSTTDGTTTRDGSTTPNVSTTDGSTTRDATIGDVSTTRDATPRGVTATPSTLVPTALRLDGIGDPSLDPAFLAGRWTVQDAGAQLVGYLAAPRAGMRILDACSGVGGKATHLAELTDDQVTIDAADQSKTKLGLLEETARRLGLASIRTHACDLLDPAAPLAPAYDLILLDAPCSGLGVLRRHPDAKWRLLPDTVPRMAALQAQLLDAVVARLAPGGTLIYAVCTFTRAEGPEQIAALVKRSGLVLVEERRTWPPEADAFYIAKLERRARI